MDPIRESAVAPGRIDWDDLRFFLAIARHGSLTAAARALRTTQPTMSRRLEGLEQRLGVELALRQGDGLRLTDAGSLVAEHAESMERLAASLSRAVLQRDKEPVGEVSVSAPGGLASYFLAPDIADFQRAWPKIGLALRNDAASASEADVRISFVEAKRMEEVAVPLGWVHYVALAAEDYLSIYGTPTNLLEAFQHRILLHTAYQNQVERWMAKARPVMEAVDAGFVTDDGPALLMAARCGAGIAVLPSYAAWLEPELRLLEVGQLARLRFWMIFDKDRGDIVRCRRVIDWIKSVFDHRTNPWFREEFISPQDFALCGAREPPTRPAQKTP